MKPVFAAISTALMATTVFGQDLSSVHIRSPKEPVNREHIAAMDFNRNGTIDSGSEARAVVRYVNEVVFREYDLDHDGQLRGAEAENYVRENVQPNLDRIDEFYDKSAYPAADRRFGDGVPVADPARVLETSPLAPRASRIAFAIEYAKKGESGKEVETIKSGVEFRWASFAFRQIPIEAGSKLSFSNETTVLTGGRNEVERWTFEPFRLTLGARQWRVQPIVGLGWGRSKTENAAVGQGRTVTEDDEFVWNYGVAIPIAKDYLKLTVTQEIRQEEIGSGKRSDEIRTGLELDIRKLLEFPN